MHSEGTPSFSKYLDQIEALEKELTKKVMAYLEENKNIYTTDFFVLGAAKRVLALAAGFRHLISEKNFTCAASLLRMQIDTAARVHAINYMPDCDNFGRAMIAGERFDQQKDWSGERLRDAYIIRKLGQKFPWVVDVYRETSGFVHLSGKHFYASVADLDDASRILNISVGATDPSRPEQDYFEILEAFRESTRLSSSMIMGYFGSRSSRNAEKS